MELVKKMESDNYSKRNKKFHTKTASLIIIATLFIGLVSFSSMDKNSYYNCEEISNRTRKLGAKYVVISSPSSSSNWLKGSGYYIRWSTIPASISYVVIRLWKGISLLGTITSRTYNDGSYYWVVPSSLSSGSDYFVEIYDYDDYWDYDFSPDFTISTPVSQSITVTTPSGSSSWEAGTSHTIRWSSTGSISYVKIQLYKGSSLQQTITSSTSNDGSYTWSISSSLSSGTDYRIKITSTSSSSVYDYSSYFTITRSTITVTTPSSSTDWELGSSNYIYWSSTGSISTVRIELYKGSTYQQTIISSTSNDGSHFWTLPTNLAPASDYRIKISSTSISSVYDYSVYFTITMPPILVHTPSSSSYWYIGTTYTLNWSSTGIITDVSIDLYKGADIYQNLTLSTPNDGSYSWTIPTSFSLGSNFRIKVTDVANSSVFDYSSYFSIALPTITVSIPSSSSYWYIGSNYAINWVSTGNISSVAIELYNGASLHRNITSSTSNDGSYLWTIPTSFSLGSNFRIKVTDVANSSVFDYSSYFSIALPTITVTIPSSSSLWVTGSSYYINWGFTGNISSVAIQLYNGSSLYQNITLSTSNDGSHLWSIPGSLSIGSDYRVKVTSTSNSSITDYSSYFTITVPSITVTTPSSSTYWYTGSNNYLYWSSVGNITSVTIELYKSATLHQNISLSTPNDGSHLWSIPTSFSLGSDFRIKIKSTDNATISDYSDYFTIALPTITVTTPSSSTYWYSGSSYYIQWSYTGSFPSVRIELYKGASLQQTIVSSTSNDRSHYWPISASLTPGTDYRIKIYSTTNSSISDFSSYFEIRTPTITVTDPSSSTTWQGGYSYAIRWSSTGATSSVKIELFIGSTFERTIISSTSNDGYHSWSVPTTLTSGSNYRIKITSTSSSSVYDYSSYFTITIILPPSITVTTPSSSTSWQAGGRFNIYWTSTGSISSVKIQLYKGSSLEQTITTSTSNDGSYSWFIPSSLSSSSNYRIKITSTSSSSIYDYSSYFTITSEEDSVTTESLALKATLITIGVICAIGVAIGLISKYGIKSTSSPTYSKFKSTTTPTKVISDGQYRIPSSSSYNYDHYCLRCGTLVRAKKRCSHCYY